MTVSGLAFFKSGDTEWVVIDLSTNRKGYLYVDTENWHFYYRDGSLSKEKRFAALYYAELNRNLLLHGG